MSKPTLTWLFTATHTDGTVVKQTVDDISKTNPEKSAYFDIDQEQIDLFVLNENRPFGARVAVDLVTGLFEINGQIVDLAPQHFVKTAPFRLIYFRDTRVERDIKATVQKNMSIKEEVTGGRHFVYAYHLGWQTLYNGENIERVIAIRGSQ